MIKLRKTSFEVSEQTRSISVCPALIIEFRTYLDSSCGDMAVVRFSGGKRWAIVESELGFSFRHLKLLVEGVDLLPVGKHFFFLSREVRLVRH